MSARTGGTETLRDVDGRAIALAGDDEFGVRDRIEHDTLTASLLRSSHRGKQSRSNTDGHQRDADPLQSLSIPNYTM
ncbi:MAG: hypothetical protein EDR02_08070 [Actinobacteria bacterium]|nr:MAG: hypothetical protein EDR02_08070 [Actinomycetota bacterium]RIK08541.1 MAG: hypothetical protein DCC48_00935 [Acidobacteriota bacterium]